MGHSYSSCSIVLQPKIILHVTVLQDKEMAIPHEDLGRSITTVQVLQRKHEAFERELSALGSKVRGGETMCMVKEIPSFCTFHLTHFRFES